MEQEKKKDQVVKLRRKANLSRHVHFMIGKRFRIYSGFLHFFTLVGATITAILTFANYDTFLPIFESLIDDIYKLIVGTFASMVFVLTITEEFLKLGERATQHENVGKQLTTFVRNAAQIENLEIINEDDITRLTMQYTMISEAAPSIHPKYFIKAKKDLHKRIEISKILERNPFANVFFLKILMSYKQTSNITVLESKERTEKSEKQ